MLLRDNNETLLFKVRMSRDDLERFKSFIEVYTGDLSLGIKRKRKLDMLLDNNSNSYQYKVELGNFSRIDGFPFFVINKSVGDYVINQLIKDGELIDFEFEDLDEVEFELIQSTKDIDYRKKNPGKIKWFDNTNKSMLYE